MDPLTIAAICTLVLKNEAATTAVPPGTNCAQIERDQRANAAKANVRVDDESDREAIGRVAYAEAANQGDRGIAAVVYTIINRVGSGRFGNSVNAVLNAPKQFEPVSRYGGDWRRLPPAPPAARARVDAIVGLALRGELADETGGALYFQNPRIVAARERAGLVSRGLTNFGGQTPSAVIGDHSFYTGPRYANVRTRGPGGAIVTAGNDQSDFIDGGGAIFVGGQAEAFDPASTIRERQDEPADARAIDLTRQIEPALKGRASERPDDAASELASLRAPILAEQRADNAPDDAGGMFVLRSGKTSSAPQ
ncbi:cell wall hydrolase [Sphingobium sp. Z007]|uniref:cell wall hydrolase n=1 Tax=Sphingobium sp. Z007 TaxID=627495 RepID=UPI000B4992B6|nr:cell wall hydrolase [Sphingobium sp. Z007]